MTDTPITSYWGALLTPKDVVLQNQTPPANIPYDDLPGSRTVDSGVVAAGVSALFPLYDGVTHKLTDVAGKPANFDNAPADLSPSDFLKWHSAYQLEYLKAHGGAGGQAIEIGPGTDPAPNNKIHAL